jgi:ferredoxin--NADP+ reductase
VIGITTRPEIPPRLYSIASGEQEDEICILFSVKKDGLLTPGLAGCRKGDRILISPPSGNFLPLETPSWWIAAGTGIAPFAAALRSDYPPPEKMIHGGRYGTSFYFSGILEPLLRDRYVRCISSAAEENHFHGRVTDYLGSLPSVPPSIKYYLCGSAEMVVDTRDVLISRGVPFDQVVAEIYF